MNRKIFLKWLKVNILFFTGASIVALFLALLFPDAMLGFVRKWGEYIRSVGPTVLEPTSKEALFVNIFTKNSLMTILYFLGSLLFFAPLLAIIVGTFYSLGLMSAIERGVVPFWHSPILIAIEVSFILLTISFASALGTEIFSVKPERDEILDFWKRNWRRLLPEQERNWRAVFKENNRELVLFIVIILSLLLFGAWFEVFI
jgi:uncharacterized membrane protein SpoIIM required for sporulation